MEWIIATTNAGKVREVRAALPTHSILAPTDIEVPPPPEVVEDGMTYFENALKKAAAYFASYDRPVLADDSGLEVDALGGAPGLHSARYGGDIPWPQRCQKLVAAIGKDQTRTARFRCVLCFYDGVLPVFFQGVSEGHIVERASGQEGFGYDPIFFSERLGKTFGDAGLEEKQRVSHRGAALKSFSEWWKANGK